MNVFLQEQFFKSMKTSYGSKKKLNESMQEIDRQLFASLNKEGDGHYYILVDGYYEKDFYADSDDEAKEKFRQWINRDKTNNVTESCGKKSKKKLKEANWRYTLKCGNALRNAIYDGDAQEVIRQLWNGYKELMTAGIIDDWQYESYTDDLIDSEYWDEDEMEENTDWALNNFYDLCDNTDVWIPLHENLISEYDWDESTDGIWDDYYDGKISEKERDKRLARVDKMLDEAFDTDSWVTLSDSEQYAAEYALGLVREGCPIDDAVYEGVQYVNNANAEPEYEDEEFYGDEADYSKVFAFVVKTLDNDEEEL